MKKKGILIAIIVLIVLLVLAGGAFAYIYFATDLLKTDKELFAKYAVQMGDSENGFIPSILEEYGNKKSTTAYENNGSISANTTITADTSADSTLQELSSVLEQANAANISFSGRVDNANKKAEQNIVLNYSDTVNFPFNYKQDGDVYGLQADVISPNYIAFENNNLQEFAQKLGVTDVSSIPNKIEFKEIQSLKFTDEEKTHILEQYVMPVFEGLADEKFTRAENTDGSITYTLSITNIELRNIEVQMLETLKNDTMMLNKINTILQEIYSVSALSETVNGEDATNAIEITAEDIDNTIANLNEENLKEVMVAISVTQNDGVTNRISATQEGTTITLGKEQAKGSVTYELTVLVPNNDEESVAEGAPESATITFTMAYSGLNTNNTTETISMNLTAPGLYSQNYSYTNALTFGNTVTFDAFPEDTAYLNNSSAEEIVSFLSQVGQIIAQNNENQMNQIGFPTDMTNPIIAWFVGPARAMFLYNTAASAIGSSQPDFSSAEAEQGQQAFNEAMMYEDQHMLNVEYWVNEALVDIENANAIY